MFVAIDFDKNISSHIARCQDSRFALATMTVNGQMLLVSGPCPIETVNTYWRTVGICRAGGSDRGMNKWGPLRGRLLSLQFRNGGMHLANLKLNCWCVSNLQVSSSQFMVNMSDLFWIEFPLRFLCFECWCFAVPLDQWLLEGFGTSGPANASVGGCSTGHEIPALQMGFLKIAELQSHQTWPFIVRNPVRFFGVQCEKYHESFHDISWNHEISEYLPDILPDISSFDWRSQLTQGLAAKVSLLGDDETSKKDTFC